MVKEKAMASLAAISPGNIGGVDSLFSTGPRHDSAVDRRPVQLKPEKRIERYGHRAAVVLSSSRTLRSSLEQALFARGAAVANLTTLPPLAHLQDLLSSGLILLAPPDNHVRPHTSEWIEAAEMASTQESVRAVLTELERRGLLVSRGVLFAGEGI